MAEDHGALGERREIGCRFAMMAVETEVIRTKRIDQDDDDVLLGRGLLLHARFPRSPLADCLYRGIRSTGPEHRCDQDESEDRPAPLAMNTPSASVIRYHPYF